MSQALPTLPDTALPPASRHQRTRSADASGLFVFTSRTRSPAARAPSTARYSSSKASSRYGSADRGHIRRGKSRCASTWKMSLPSTSRSTSPKYRRITSPAVICGYKSSAAVSRPRNGTACSEPSTRSKPATATTAAALAPHR